MKFDFSKEGSKCRYLEAGLRLFAKHGYDLVSVRDISKEAGTSEAALYKHFKSKEEMALYLFRIILRTYTKEIARIAQQTDIDTITRLQEMQRYTYALYHVDPESVHFALLSQYKFWAKVEDELKPHFWMKDLLIEGMEKGEIEKVSILTQVSLYTGLILEPLIQYTMFEDPHVSWSEFTDEVTHAVRKLLEKRDELPVII